MSTEIPDRLKNRPTYRGFIIPAISIMDAQGVPDFRVIDMEKWHQIVNQRLCAICGEKLVPGQYWFIGGDICEANHLFFDPAMHEECARYSFTVCPFLAFSDYSKRPTRALPEGYEVINHDELQNPKRPKRLALFFTANYRKANVRGTDQWMIMAGNWITVEWFTPKTDPQVFGAGKKQ